MKQPTSKARPRKNVRPQLTTPDLVLLSLLAECPMHGYQANAELVRRCIRDWAAVSRPQVYYSLEKLARLGYVRAGESKEPAAGPERIPYATTKKGKEALADSLERTEWTSERDRPPFLTWMALSWLARPGVFEAQLTRRKEFLEQQIAREKNTIKAVLEEVGHPHHEAVWMITLIIEQFETELRWLGKVERELNQRAKAKRPSYAPG